MPKRKLKMEKSAPIFNGHTLPFLSAVTLVLMFILGQWGQVQLIERQKALVELTRKAALPRLTAAAPKLQLSAKAAYVMDVASGKALFVKNEKEPILPASTTKLATALVALEYYKPDQILTVGEISVEGQTMDLVAEEQITVRNLLYGLLLFSANDAAEVLATNYPGGRENFVRQMNELARSLGLTSTHFTNPIGLDEYLHFSTAEDLARLALAATQNPQIAEIVKIPEAEVTSVDGNIVHKLVNLNQLVGRVPGVLGVKTGWTENSQESLITLVERDGHRIIVAVLGSPDRFGESEKLIEWTYQNYSWE